LAAERALPCSLIQELGSVPANPVRRNSTPCPSHHISGSSVLSCCAISH
jgi:hypothetical protein